MEAGTACNLRSKDSCDNRLRRNDRKETQAPRIKKECNPNALQKRGRNPDYSPTPIFTETIHHRRRDGDDIHRKDTGQREQDGRLHQPRMNSRNKHIERGSKAEDNGKDKRKDCRKSRQADTSAPYTVQLLLVALVLRSKAHSAVLHGQGRHRLPSSHEVLQLPHTSKK